MTYYVLGGMLNLTLFTSQHDKYGVVKVILQLDFFAARQTNEHWPKCEKWTGLYVSLGQMASTSSGRRLQAGKNVSSCVFLCFGFFLSSKTLSKVSRSDKDPSTLKLNADEFACLFMHMAVSSGVRHIFNRWRKKNLWPIKCDSFCLFCREVTLSWPALPAWGQHSVRPNKPI